jgi:hypothetical protein
MRPAGGEAAHSNGAVESRLVLRSRIVAFVVMAGAVALIVQRNLLDLWPWVSLVIATVLGHLLILARMHMLGSSPRGRAFRRVLLWAPTLTTALCLPIGLAIGLDKWSFDALLSTALTSAVFGLAAAALGYASIERSLPESLREPDNRRWVWQPSSEQQRKLLLAWPLITLALFWLITGLGTEAECAVDGSCSSGVPVTFARFGSRRGSSMYWDRFALDLGLFASLLPAALMAATSRVRGVFAVYLLLVCLWIGVALIDNWGGLAGLGMWSETSLLELGR